MQGQDRARPDKRCGLQLRSRFPEQALVETKPQVMEVQVPAGLVETHRGPETVPKEQGTADMGRKLDDNLWSRH